MATEIARLVAVLDAQTGEFTAKMREANAQLKETGDAAKKADGDVSGSGGGMSKLAKGAGIAGLALGGVLVGGLISSVKSAMAAQVANAALDQAIKNTGQSAAAAAPQIDSAQAAARNLGFANSDTTASLTRLEQVTGSTGKSVSDLAIAENVARAKHEDLATATQSVAGALMGNARAAKQLGVMIVPVTTNIDALTAANGGSLKGVDALTIAHAKLADKLATGAATVSAISAKVKDQASIYAGTAAGGMAKFSAQMDYIKETIGTALLPALGDITQAVGKFTGYLAANPAVMKLLLVGLGALSIILVTASVATKLVTAAQTIGSIASKGFAAAQWLVNAAMDANPIMLVVIALVAIGVAFYEAWTRSATFRDIVKGAFKDATKAASDFAEFFTTDIPDAFKTIIAWVRANWPIILTVISGPFAPIVALALNAFGIRSALVTAFQGILSDITGVMGTIISAITGPFAGVGASLLGDLVSGLGDLGSAILNWIVGAFSGIGSGIVAAAGAIGGWIWQGIVFIGNLAGAIWNWVVAALNTAAGGITSAAGAIGGWIWNGVSLVGNLAGAVYNWASGAIVQVGGDVQAAAHNIANNILAGASVLGNLAGAVYNWAAGAIAQIGGNVQAAAHNIANNILAGASKIGSIAGALTRALGSAISGVGGWVVRESEAIGINIVAGIASGIRKVVGMVISAITSVAGSIYSKIRGLLGIGSPSKLMADMIGVPIVQGVAVGMQAGVGSGVIEDAASKIAPAVVGGVAVPAGVASGTSSAIGAAGGNTGGGNTITVNFGVVGNPAQAAQMVADLLVGHGRRHPGALGGLA